MTQQAGVVRWQRILLWVLTTSMLVLCLYLLWIAQWWRAAAAAACVVVLAASANRKAKPYENELLMLLLGISFVADGVDRGAWLTAVMGGMLILGAGFSALGTRGRGRVR